MYLISGRERKKLKKHLSLLKYSLKMYWFIEDVSNVYGCGEGEEEGNKRIDSMNEEIRLIELELNKKYISI